MSYDPYTEFQLLSYLLRYKSDRLAFLVDNESFNHDEALAVIQSMQAAIETMQKLLGQL